MASKWRVKRTSTEANALFIKNICHGYYIKYRYKMYQNVTLEGYFEKKSRKEQLNEQSNTFYSDINIFGYVRDTDIRNIDVWILGGCMTKEEFEARVHEIKERAWQLGADQYADGFEKGYAEGARNQDEIKYKHGYEAGVVDGKKSIEALEAERTSYNIWYEKGLEDLWEMWHWYLNNDLETIHSIFPEHKSHEAFMVMAKRVGLAESVRRIKEYMKADTGLLYSTISDLKADYTKEQIVKALKDNDIEVIEVNK